MGVSSIMKARERAPPLPAIPLTETGPPGAQDPRELGRSRSRHDEAHTEWFARTVEAHGARLTGRETYPARPRLVIIDGEPVSDAEVGRSGRTRIEVERHPERFAARAHRTVEIEMDLAALLADQEGIRQ